MLKTTENQASVQTQAELTEEQQDIIRQLEAAANIHGEEWDDERIRANMEGYAQSLVLQCGIFEDAIQELLTNAPTKVQEAFLCYVEFRRTLTILASQNNQG